jgi:hypothetical protein
VVAAEREEGVVGIEERAVEAFDRDAAREAGRDGGAAAGADVEIELARVEPG